MQPGYCLAGRMPGIFPSSDVSRAPLALRVRTCSSSRVICAISSAAWNSVSRRLWPVEAYVKFVPIAFSPLPLLWKA